MNCSPPGFSVHGILQARILEWLPYPPPRDLPDPGIEPKSLMSTALASGFFTTSATWEALSFSASPKTPGFHSAPIYREAEFQASLVYTVSCLTFNNHLCV